MTDPKAWSSGLSEDRKKVLEAGRNLPVPEATKQAVWRSLSDKLPAAAVTKAAAHGPATLSWRKLVAVGAGVLLPVAAGIALFFHAGTRAPLGGGALVAKGLDGPRVSARCQGRPNGECHLGDRLMFEAEGVVAERFFAAYADCAKERVWYFPARDGELPAVAPSAGRTVIAKAARVGREHGAGSCTLHLFLVEHPVSREALLSGTTGVQTTVTINIEP